MGDKNSLMLRLALVLGVMCLIALVLVPIKSAEFFVLLFALAANALVILVCARKARRER